ncbi:hypothetical protein BDB01DRAFT_830574 [Pilobolus umbonatus]|nr:hypothetical protein BDB01DRAFT_830574 [Pilobolus umbonatus]
MRYKVLIGLFLFLLLMGILGFAPISLHEVINDKILHFTVFFILAVILYCLWNMSVKRNLLLSMIVIMIISVGSEFIQGLLPYRSFDVYDIVSNVLGGICGMMMSSSIDYLLRWRRENRRRWGDVTTHLLHNDVFGSAYLAFLTCVLQESFYGPIYPH